MMFWMIVCLAVAGWHGPVDAMPYQRASETSAPQTPVLLFFGDSITAGFGVKEQEAFPALIQKKLDALGWKICAVNGGLSGETSAGGLRRIDWVLQNRVDIFVLELGGNDALRGVDLEDTRRNLRGIIDRVRARYPQARIVIAGMKAPPNLGRAYAARFEALYEELARSAKTALIPFLLLNVGGIPYLNLPDGIHPTPDGHRIIAETTWTALKPLLGELAK